jgi:hypothetical protein
LAALTSALIPPFADAEVAVDHEAPPEDVDPHPATTARAATPSATRVHLAAVLFICLLPLCRRLVIPSGSWGAAFRLRKLGEALQGNAIQVFASR